MPKEHIIKIGVDVEGGIQETKRLKEEVEGVDGAAEGASGAFQTMTGRITAMGVALKAAGIGLVVAAFNGMKNTLTQNQIVLDGFNRGMERFNFLSRRATELIIESTQDTKASVADMGKWYLKTMVTNPKLALKVGKLVTDGIKDTNDAAKEYADTIVELRKEVLLAEADQALLRAEYEKDAEIQRQVRDNVNKTFDERITANQKLKAILEKQFEEEKALAQKKIDLAKMEMDDNKGKIEFEIAHTNALTLMAELENRITGQRSEMLVNETALENEKQAAIDATNDAAEKALEDKKRRLQEEQDLIDKQTDDEIMAWAKKERARHKDLADQELVRREELRIAKETAQKKLEIARDEAQMKRDIVASSLGGIASLIGEETKAGKALAIAQAYIHMYSAATNALAPKSLGGAGPVFGPIVAVGAIAAGLANIKNIINTDLPGVEDSGGGGGGTPEVPGFVGDLVPNMESIEQPELGGATPVQAYVVENDISNAQALQEELEIQSTL
jgi:hypothetical protein